MKKSLLVLCLIFFSISLVSALDITLTKDSYYPSETLQAEINDAFTQNLAAENLGIYSAESVHESPTESGLIKIDAKYLYYAVLPSIPGVYSLKIENAKYYEGSTETDKTVIKNFSIIATNQSYLRFSPGQVYTSKNFSIIVKSYNNPQEVNAEFTATNQKQTINIPINSEKTFYFSVTGITAFTKSEIKLGQYSIPVIIAPVSSQLQAGAGAAEDIEDLIKIDTKEINLVVLKNKDYQTEILVKNRINDSIGEIKIDSSDPEIKASPSKIEDFDKSQIIKITINTQENLDGWIKISINDSSIKIPVSVKTTSNKSAVIDNSVSESCTSLGGIICNYSAGEQCTGQSRIFTEGACCLAECKKAGGFSSGWVWGFLIIVVLIIGGYYFYSKSRQNPKKTGEEILREKTDKYKERLNPEIKTGEEVRKGLGKI